MCKWQQMIITVCLWPFFPSPTRSHFLPMTEGKPLLSACHSGCIKVKIMMICWHDWTPFCLHAHVKLRQQSHVKGVELVQFWNFSNSLQCNLPASATFIGRHFMPIPPPNVTRSSSKYLHLPGLLFGHQDETKKIETSPSWPRHTADESLIHRGEEPHVSQFWCTEYLPEFMLTFFFSSITFSPHRRPFRTSARPTWQTFWSCSSSCPEST